MPDSLADRARENELLSDKAITATTDFHDFHYSGIFSIKQISIFAALKLVLKAY